jgi:hypothetical protein
MPARTLSTLGSRLFFLGGDQRWLIRCVLRILVESEPKPTRSGLKILAGAQRRLTPPRARALERLTPGVNADRITHGGHEPSLLDDLEAYGVS